MEHGAEHAANVALGCRGGDYAAKTQHKIGFLLCLLVVSSSSINIHDMIYNIYI
jgi:hypothetical protein